MKYQVKRLNNPSWKVKKHSKSFSKMEKVIPKYKKKNVNDSSIYLTGTIKAKRHKIQVPKFKYIRLKEYGYIPMDNKVISCRLVEQGNRYFIVPKCEVNKPNTNFTNDGIGIDLGLKTIMNCSNGVVYDNINKSPRMRQLEKRKKRLQRQVARKYKINKKGERYKKTNNILKIESKIRDVDFKMLNIKNDYYNKIVDKIIKQEPSFISLENLVVKNLLKNKHLSKDISKASWYSIRIKIKLKCEYYGIEFRLVNTFYPSSKLCSNCNTKKIDLKLKDRTYKCDHCGLIIDRDINAAINLKNTMDYKVV